MIATWMLYATLVGVLVSLAGHALDRAARVNRLPTRFIWMAAMTATVLAPFAGYALRWNALTRAGSSDGVSMGAPLAVPAELIAGPAASPTILARLSDALGGFAARIDRPVAFVWAGLSLLLLGRLLYASAVLWRRRREWTAREIAGVSLFVTPDLGPAVVALPSSRILVPEWLLSLDESQVSTVLHHEREHHAAGDARTLVVASIATALVPWNPALWWQMRRLRLAVEMDCDARVLRTDPRVDRYGTLLLAIAQHPRASLHPAATLTESTSDLERRIDVMTSKPPSAPRLMAAGLVAVAVGIIIGACAMQSPDVIMSPTSRDVAPAPVGDGPYQEFQVEKPAQAKPNQMPPRYPDQLRRANIEGRVVASFVVDTLGAVDLGTFEILKSDHDLFTNAVRGGVKDMVFSPAEVGGHRVKQIVKMPFMFTLDDSTRTRLRAESIISDSLLKRSGGGRSGAGRGQPFEFKVSPPAQAKPNQAPPQYPNQLRAAGIEGQVIAKFVVDTNGRADPRTFEVIKSDHDLFAGAVRQAIGTMEFTPAMVGGRKVKQLMEMPFVFSLSKGSTPPRPEPGAAGPTPVREMVVNAVRNTPTITRLPDGRFDVAYSVVESRHDTAAAAAASRVPFAVAITLPTRTPAVDVGAVAYPNQMPPKYPRPLRDANMEGQVVARFIVRADGTPDLSTFLVMKSDHELFTGAVREVLTSYRFYPAKKDGRPVDSEVRMPFVFSLSK